MRWIWIDRFVAFESGKAAVAIKNLSLAEDYFAVHFSGRPIMPACLILEGLAQTGGILVGEACQFKEKVVLAKIPKALFHREMYPGEQLRYHVEIIHLRPEGASVAAKVVVDGEVTAEAEIFFAHLDQSRSNQLFGEQNFVFGGEMRHLVAGLAKLPPLQSS